MDYGDGDIAETYDNDYYYRKLPPTPFVSCDLPGTSMAMCAPKEYTSESTLFCNEVNYDFICIPIDHFLWPTWTLE